MKKTRSKAKQHVENPLEKLIGIGLGSLEEHLGFADSKEKQKFKGDLREGQELNLKKLQEANQETQEKKIETDPGIEYSKEVIQTGDKAVNRENREMEAQMREIMAEIKKLADSSKELQMQFKSVAVEQYVATPGKYHKTFFSWLLSMVRAARMKVENSETWLAAMQSKRKSREYGAMAKKYKSSFTLNNERTVATQVG